MTQNKKVLLLATIASVFFVSTLSLLYLNLLRSRQPIIDNQTPTPTPQSTGIIQEPSIPDSTVDWKTYTNSELGFSFKYPTGWYVEENQETIQVLSDRNKPTGDYQMEMESCYPYIQFQIKTGISDPLIPWIIDDVLAVSKEYFVEVQNKNENNLLLGEFFRKNFGANEFVTFMSDGIGDNHHYAISNNELNVDFSNSNCNPLFRNQYIPQILSTFKFTN